MLIPKDWRILQKSNVVIFDEMGYPLRLFVIAEDVRGLFGRTKLEIRHEWIDIDLSCYDEEKDVVCKWI